MKYDVSNLPLGSIDRAKVQLANLDLLKALKTCRNGNITLSVLVDDLKTCLERLYAGKNYGVILSGYYAAGAFGEYSVEELLKGMFEVHDYPSFLKQAYRFDFYDALQPEIDEAIAWHFAHNLPDAEAWRRKFAKLREQELLRSLSTQSQDSLEIQEELPDDSREAPRFFQLKPIATTKLQQPLLPTPESTDDPYIISQTARVKMEQANAIHSRTLSILKEYLEQRSLPVSASKLIDAYSVLSKGPAIFEIKSISEDNERQQIRHALSQLYEYRFLHSLPQATLWIVFSQPPSSQWYVDYLTGDRDIHVIWLEDNMLGGPSITLLQ